MDDFRKDETIGKLVALMLGTTSEAEAMSAWRKARELQPRGNFPSPHRERNWLMQSSEHQVRRRPVTSFPHQVQCFLGRSRILRSWPALRDRRVYLVVSIHSRACISVVASSRGIILSEARCVSPVVFHPNTTILFFPLPWDQHITPLSKLPARQALPAISTVTFLSFLSSSRHPAVGYWPALTLATQVCFHDSSNALTAFSAWKMLSIFDGNT